MFEKFSDQRASDLVSTFQYLQEEIHEWAKEKGWWDVYNEEVGEVGYQPELRSFGDQMSNFHAELSEAWEEYRKYKFDKELMIYGEMPIGDSGAFAKTPDIEQIREEHLKPEGLAVELADLLIRIMDTCGAYRIPIAEALILKMEYNASRPYRHGNKHA